MSTAFGFLLFFAPKLVQIGFIGSFVHEKRQLAEDTLPSNVKTLAWCIVGLNFAIPLLSLLLIIPDAARVRYYVAFYFLTAAAVHLFLGWDLFSLNKSEGWQKAPEPQEGLVRALVRLQWGEVTLGFEDVVIFFGSLSPEEPTDDAQGQHDAQTSELQQVSETVENRSAETITQHLGPPQEPIFGPRAIQSSARRSGETLPEYTNEGLPAYEPR